MGIYGTISVAVVVAEYHGAEALKLAAVVTGYGVSLWLAHSLSVALTQPRRDWLAATAHSWPVAEAAVPALAVALIGAVARWSLQWTSPLALGATVVNLVALQVVMLRRTPWSMRRVWATAALDLVIVLISVVIVRWLR